MLFREETGSNLFSVGSVSLLGKPPDSTVMTVATGKNLDAIPKKVVSSMRNRVYSCDIIQVFIVHTVYLFPVSTQMNA